MRINYQIMHDDQKIGDKYLPNYDKLIENASCDDEIEYLLKLKKEQFTFCYNMVYITKQKCGHYEIFQTPMNQYYSLTENLDLAEEHSATSECTRCICGIFRKSEYKTVG